MGVMSQQSISVASETVTSVQIGSYHLNITNSMLTASLTCGFLIILSVIMSLSLPKNPKTKPNKFQTFIELIGESLYNLINGISKTNNMSAKLFSLCGFFFAYIAIASWVGLIPGVGQLYVKNIEGEYVHLFRASTSDLSGTVALSVIAFVLIQFQGFRALKFGYIFKFINFSSPMKFFVGLLELISEIARLLSFSLRLFGNIFAGEVMLKIVGDLSRITIKNYSFIGLPLPSLIIALEFFVALIQAYVFVSLFLVFSSLSKEEAH
jgi:F-type H+-transporting ATPase subunit a